MVHWFIASMRILNKDYDLRRCYLVMWSGHGIINGSGLVHKRLSIRLNTSRAVDVWVSCRLLNIWEILGSISERWEMLIETLCYCRTRNSLYLILLRINSCSIIKRLSQWASSYPEKEFLYSWSLWGWLMVAADMILEFEFLTPPTFVPTSMATLACSYALCELPINYCSYITCCWPYILWIY